MPKPSPVALLLACAIAACSPPRTLPLERFSPPAHRRTPAALRHVRADCSGMACITHVVVIVQENRTFNNFFKDFPGALSAGVGYARAAGGGQRAIPIRTSTFRDETYPGVPTLSDPDHSWSMSLIAWDGPAKNVVGSVGKMDGFALNDRTPNEYTYEALAHGTGTVAGVAPYWQLARSYALADRMFPTEFGPSFTGHLALIASTSTLAHKAPASLANYPGWAPWGCDDQRPDDTTSLVDADRRLRPGAGPFPCFAESQMHTLASTLDAANVSWAYYAPAIAGYGAYWSIFDAIRYVRYGDCSAHSCWRDNVVSPPSQILRDAMRYRAGADDFPNVAWVAPPYLDSDHAGNCDTSRTQGCFCTHGIVCTSDHGPSWVAQIVNAIGKNEALWKHTAIVVVWDDWGGWYDPVAPPQLDFRGPGIRVPCIIVSPYARRGYVSHTRYEFGSIVKFVEQVFALPPLGPPSAGYTDVRHGAYHVNSIAGAFDFSQPPAAFAPVDAPYSAQYFLDEGDAYALDPAPDDQ